MAFSSFHAAQSRGKASCIFRTTARRPGGQELLVLRMEGRAAHGALAHALGGRASAALT